MEFKGKYMTMKGDLEKYYVKDLNDATFYSYGTCKGNFNIPREELLNCLTENVLNDYCLVEKKLDKYMFMVDIDFKDKVEPFVNVNGKKFPGNGDTFVLYHGKEDEISGYLIEVINKVVESKDYIYCDKWKDGVKLQGVHLYYPNVMVDSKRHREIFNDVFKVIIKEKKYDFTEKVWRLILDGSIASPHVSLRLPYFKLEGSSYKPNEEKSTYGISGDVKEQIKIVLGL